MASMFYAKYGIAVALLASLLTAVPTLAYAQAGQLTVSVERGTYGAGETIMVTGTVPAVIEGQPVALQVFNPRNTMYTIAQPTPGADGTFSYEFKVGGTLGISGIYTVKVTYSGQSAQTTFEFTGGEPTVQPGKFTFEFEGKQYTIDADLSNGSVTEVSIDKDFMSIIIVVRTTGTDDGTLTVTLPRSIIDARLGDDGMSGDDDEWIVLVDGDEGDFQETEVTATGRTLSIEVPSGTEEIEILGTWVVPEFGILAALVLAAAVGAIVVFSRKNQILKVLPQH